MKNNSCMIALLTVIWIVGTVDWLEGLHSTPREGALHGATENGTIRGIRPEITIRPEPGKRGLFPFSLALRGAGVSSGEDGVRASACGESPLRPGQGIPSIVDLINLSAGGGARMDHECDGPGDFIVGDNPPDEVVVIESDTTIYADVCVENEGLLQVNGAKLTVVGDITLLSDGKLVIDGGQLNVIEEWLYQYGCLMTQRARLEIRDSQVSLNGQNMSLVAVDSATVLLQNTIFPGAFLTTLLRGQASMEVNGCTKAGEYIPMDSTNLSLADCDTAIMWFTFPDSSTGTLQLPDEEGLIEHWVFPTDSVTGIDYRITMDSTSHVKSGVLTFDGSELTIESSDVAALGLIFSDSPEDSIEISGLVNDTQYSNFTVGLEDRLLRLVDSYVNAWNFYPFDTSYVRLENSVFGEVLTSDTSRIEIYGSICDGRGGYVGAGGASTLFMAFSTVQTQTVIRDSAVAFFYETNLPTHKTSVSDRSALILLNSYTAIRPVVEDRAILIEALIGLPSVTPIDAVIPVTGTAFVTTGPNNPAELEFYELSYCPGYDTGECDAESLWVLFGTGYNPVFMDTLGFWNTDGLPAGPYTIRHSVSFSYPEVDTSSLATFKSVYLSGGTGMLPGEEVPGLGGIALFQNSPNPCNPSTEIRFTVGSEETVVLRIYNVRGRKVRTLINRRLSTGSHRFVWNGTDDWGMPLPSGVYLYRLDAAGESLTRKMILMR